MADRHHYNSRGQYTGKTSSLSPAQMGGKGIALLLVASLFAIQWASHNYWLMIGVCSLIISAYIFLFHAFRNFRELNFGIVIIIIIALTGSGYFEITRLHKDKLGYAEAQRLLHRVAGI